MQPVGHRPWGFMINGLMLLIWVLAKAKDFDLI